MCYGASDSGKSTQARYVAEYIYRTTGKKTRLIALDRGSLWAPCQKLVEKGIVIPCEFPTSYEFNPYAIMRKFRRGEWPKDGVINRPTAVESKNPVTGLIEYKYKTNTVWTPWGQEETDTIGAVVVDSLTSFATAYMSDTKQKNIRASAKDPTNAPRNEEGEQMGTNTEAHYGDAHTEILDCVQAFQTLPVHIVMFTALEGLGNDDSTGIKRPALGPETVGKAINGKLPSKVNHCFHLTAEGVGAQKKVKAWYGRHDSDIPKLQWPAKVALDVDDLANFWKKYPNGFIPLSLEKGIGEFLEFLNGAQK